MPNNDYENEDVTLLESEENVEKKEIRKLSIKNQFKTAKSRTKFITRVAMFSALSTVFYCWLKFPITPPFPAFLEVNFSNLFIILGSLFTGPIGGIIIVGIRFLFKIILVPTHTFYIGELTDVLLSLAIMLPASLMYLYKHDKKGGIIGILLSYLSWIISSIIINWTISLPTYSNLWGVENVLYAIKAVIPSATMENMTKLYLLLSVLPFNALVGLINCGVALIVYKKLSKLLKTIGI